jgi:L-aspartate oxidase
LETPDFLVIGAGVAGLRGAIELSQAGSVLVPILALYELRNIHTVALLIARCALAREESRGAHFRADFPTPRAEFEKHSLVSRGNEVIYR